MEIVPIHAIGGGEQALETEQQIGIVQQPPLHGVHRLLDFKLELAGGISMDPLPRETPGGE